MNVVDVAITLDSGRSNDPSIVAAVESAGFVVDRVIPTISAIYGHGPADQMSAVQAIDGVSGIRAAGTYQLPPLSSKIPQ